MIKKLHFSKIRHFLKCIYFLNFIYSFVGLESRNIGFNVSCHVPVVENKKTFHDQNKYFCVAGRRRDVPATLPQERVRICPPRVNIRHHLVHVKGIQS